MCLCVLCSNLHIVHAEEIDDNEDIIIEFDDSWQYIDPNTPMLLADEEVIGASGINKYSCAYSYADVNGNYGSLTWYNYAENTLTFPTNQSIYSRVLTFFNTDIKQGTYDVVVTLGVPNNYTITSNVTMYMYTQNAESGAGSAVNESSKVLTPQKVYDGYTEMAYYTITFKDVEFTKDVGTIRLDFYGYCSSQENSIIRPGQFKFTKQDETPGLLKNIIQYVISIWEGITNLPSNIANSLKGFFDNIVNAVTDLGNFLIEGVKNLFVPTEENLTAYFDKWKALLSDRFGALYEVFDIIVDYFETFSNTGSKSTVTFPSVSIPLAGSDFVFGGWEVSLIPVGFTVIFDALKLMINVLCTVAFVNALRKRYDRLVEK